MLNFFKSIFKNKLTAFILMPLVFAFLGLVLFSVVGAPIINPAIGSLNLIATDFKVDNATNYDLLDLNTLPQYSGEIKASTITFPGTGDRYGILTIDGTEVEADLYFGDGKRELKLGLGQYNGSCFPGTGGTILISGHNNSAFKDLKSAKVGSKVNIRTNYGMYVYEITKTQVTLASDSKAFDLFKDEENLVLYTCYPFDMLGITPQRYFVYGKIVSGPKVLVRE